MHVRKFIGGISDMDSVQAALEQVNVLIRGRSLTHAAVFSVMNVT